MSTPVSSSSSLHPTRQQLDELDALMERMLELPVKPAAEEAKGLGAEEPTLSALASESPFAEFSPHGIASYQTEESDASVTNSEGAFQFRSSNSVQENGISSVPPRNGQSPFRFAESTSVAANRGAGSKIAFTRTPAGVADDGPPPSLWLWPVVGINQIYDAVMGGMGSPGRIMRGTGRAWLGWVGLLMLAAALAWGVFDWLQWAG
jgi:hypothetical protein